MRSTPRLSNRKGFTLIELLIVVVIIGILAAVAIPKFANTKEKAYVASMKSDLKNLVTVEESYFADKSTYGANTDVNAPAVQLQREQGQHDHEDRGRRPGLVGRGDERFDQGRLHHLRWRRGRRGRDLRCGLDQQGCRRIRRRAVLQVKHNAG
jgi:prepilin-type N-terminal cleavage/methylation domain-containing protein